MILVTIENGEILVPELKLSKNVFIPESIATAKNGLCLVPISEKVEINFSERVTVTPLCENQLINLVPSKQNFNISELIETNHLNHLK